MKKLLTVRKGDIVQIGPAPSVPHLGVFQAEVTQISENSIGHTIIAFKRLVGKTEKFPLVNLSLVTQVIRAAPYVMLPRARVNRIAAQPTYHVNGCRYYKTGTIEDLTLRALATVRHIDIPYGIAVHRAEVMYNGALWPGKLAGAEAPAEAVIKFLTRRHTITVRWKVFERWVHKNAQRLTMTKAEHRATQRAWKKVLDDDLGDAIRGDVDRMMEEDLHDEPLYASV